MKNRISQPTDIKYRIVTFWNYPPVFCFGVDESRSARGGHRMKVYKYSDFEAALKDYKFFMRRTVPEELHEGAIASVRERKDSMPPKIDFPPLW